MLQTFTITSRNAGIAANLPGFAGILPVFERFPGFSRFLNGFNSQAPGST